jgi:hypothetical protein
MRPVLAAPAAPDRSVTIVTTMTGSAVPAPFVDDVVGPLCDGDLYAGGVRYRPNSKRARVLVKRHGAGFFELVLT